MNTDIGHMRLGLTLPVSGWQIVLRAPTGAEDLLLVESAGGDVELSLILISRLARLADGVVPADVAHFDWSRLSATDLDLAILRLRQSLLGNRVVADIVCSTEGCGERIDISFDIESYVAHYLPDAAQRGVQGPAVEKTEEANWLRLGGTDIQFRLPTVADLIAVAGFSQPSDEIARQCMRPGSIALEQQRRIEEAMESLAPSLSQDLQGICPECGQEVSVYFDARRYCLQELRDRAAFIYEDVHLLAQQYHWSESDILALPSARRLTYAALARNEGVWSA